MRKEVMVFLVFLLLPCLVHAQAEARSVTISLVNQDPDPAIAGDLVEVRLGVQNLGSDPLNDVVVEFVPSYPFELVSGEGSVQEIASLQPSGGGYYTANLQVVKFKVRVDKDAIAGAYAFKVKNYVEGSIASTVQSISVPVESKDNAQIIHIDKNVLVPGMIDHLQFTINNVGSSPLRDLKFYWSNDDDSILPVGSDNTRYIKYIDVGESEKLDFQVIADTNANPGLYKLDLHLSYDDPLTNGTKTISTIAGVYVGGGTDFDVAFSQSSSGTTSFTVANVGSNPAYSVSVVVPQQGGWAVSGSNAVIIGNLNKGDYTVASFSLSSAQNRTGAGAMTGVRTFNRTERSVPDASQFRSMNVTDQNTVRMQIVYTDTMGQRRTVEKDVQMGSSSLASTGVNGFSQSGAFGARRTTQQNVFVEYKWYFIGALVLVAVAFFFYRRRKSRMYADEPRPKRK